MQIFTTPGMCAIFNRHRADTGPACAPSLPGMAHIMTGGRKGAEAGTKNGLPPQGNSPIIITLKSRAQSVMAPAPTTPSFEFFKNSTTIFISSLIGTWSFILLTESSKLQLTL